MIRLRQAITQALLGALLGATAVWFLAPLFQPKPAPPPLPVWAWAPGYWEFSPACGIVRIIPIAPSMLVNPPASAAPAGLPLQHSGEGNI